MTLPARVTVLGSGTMSVGIATCFADHGCDVAVWARSSQSADRAAAGVDSALRNLAKYGLNHASVATARRQVLVTTDLESAVGHSALVVETIREDLTAKKVLLARISKLIVDDTLIVSNTSSLSLDEIFSTVPFRDRVGGLHWFNPAEVVRLVEVVPASTTSELTLATLRQWCAELGKEAVTVKVPVVGFIANRLQYAVLREAYHLVAQGVCDYSDIDRAMVAGLGPRWAAIGPFESMDLAGLDVHLSVCAALFPALSSATDAPADLEELVSQGDLGAKAGRGLRGAYDAARLTQIQRDRMAAIRRGKESASK